MLDVFDVALDYIHENRFAWRQEVVANAVTGIHWQIINSARGRAERHADARETPEILRRIRFMPNATNGEARQYVDAMSEGSGVATPTKDWSWVNPEPDPFTRHTVSDSTTRFSSATNVENAPSSAKLIGRGWINDIP